MKKIKNDLNNTIIIEKSKFITNIFRVNNVEEVNQKLREINKKYYDATHNCYAYILDNQNIQKCSDEGEPAKTAGYPMLDVLLKNDLTDILAVTTRYFGGIKLGAGGLVRAYSKSVSEALLNAKYQTSKMLKIYQIEMNYPTYNRLSATLENYTILEQSFSSEVSIKVGVLLEDEKYFLDTIKNNSLSKTIIRFIMDKETDIDL